MASYGKAVNQLIRQFEMLPSDLSSPRKHLPAMRRLFSECDDDQITSTPKRVRTATPYALQVQFAAVELFIDDLPPVATCISHDPLFDLSVLSVADLCDSELRVDDLLCDGGRSDGVSSAYSSDLSDPDTDDLLSDYTSEEDEYYAPWSLVSSSPDVSDASLLSHHSSLNSTGLDQHMCSDASDIYVEDSYYDSICGGLEFSHADEDADVIKPLRFYDSVCEEEYGVLPCCAGLDMPQSGYCDLNELLLLSPITRL